jgi:hypothetical protein
VVCNVQVSVGAEFQPPRIIKTGCKNRYIADWAEDEIANNAKTAIASACLVLNLIVGIVILLRHSVEKRT